MAAKLLSQVVDFYQKRYREMSGVPQGDGTPIEQMIPALIALPPEVYGAYAFRRDPIQGRFDRQQRKELITRALACGREQAEEYRRRFGALRPSEIARRLGLKLDSPSIPEGGGRVLFAQFTEPDRISVYQDCLDRAAETIRRHHLSPLLGHAELREVLIAHELFHELEYREGERLFTRSYRVRLWKKAAAEFLPQRPFSLALRALPHWSLRSKRKYTHIQVLEEEILAMRKEGATRQEIADRRLF